MYDFRRDGMGGSLQQSNDEAACGIFELIASRNLVPKDEDDTGLILFSSNDLGALLFFWDAIGGRSFSSSSVYCHTRQEIMYNRFCTLCSQRWINADAQ